MNHYEKREFGHRIYRLREEKGFSVEDVAVKTGLAANTIRSYENGDTMPRIDTAEIMSKMYGVTLNFFTYGKEYCSDITVLCETLPQEYQNLVLLLLETLHSKK